MSGGPVSEGGDNPQAAVKVSGRIENMPLGKWLGLTFDEARPGYARARMRVREDMLNPHGTCHGGLVFSLADSVFGAIANARSRPSVTASAEIVFVAPGQLGDELVAEAVETLVFGRSGVYDITVRNQKGDVLALFRGIGRNVSSSNGREGTENA